MMSRLDTLHIVATGDLHGALWPRDFLNLDKSTVYEGGSLGVCAGYIRELRARAGDKNVIVLDCGDVMQGSPTAFLLDSEEYFLRQNEPHPLAEMMGYVGYDAMTLGNHDIETGRLNLKKFKHSSVETFRLLAANIEEKPGHRPWYSPYILLNRGSRRIAVLGLVTEAIVNVPHEYRDGLTAVPAVETARRWMEHLHAVEHPDFIVGLFHSGYEDEVPGDVVENFSRHVVEEVGGFDLIIMGHDHKPSIVRCGDTLLANCGAHGKQIIHAELSPSGDLSVKLVDMAGRKVDKGWSHRFSHYERAVEEYVRQPIGYISNPLDSADSLSLSRRSEWMKIIHEAQLYATGATVSIAAPTSLTARVKSGQLTVADLFRFYRFDNGLKVLRLTIGELRKCLEWSYRSLEASSDITDCPKVPTGNPVYDLDTAMGIDYRVDLTRPAGQRIEIIRSGSLSNSSDENEFIEVVMNSYRASGGGGHLTSGAGLTRNELEARIVRIYPGTVRSAIQAYIARYMPLP